MKKTVLLIITLATLLTGRGLTPVQSKLADSLRQTIMISDKETLAQGLKHNNRVAKFIDRFLEWEIKSEKKPKIITEQVSRRVQSFSDDKKYTPSFTYNNVAGNAKAPVTIYFYITGSCLECLVKACELYKEVTAGSLKNKARLIAVPLKLDLPEQYLLIADKQGKLWAYLQKMTSIEERYTPEILDNIATDCRLDQKKVQNELKNRANLDFLQKASAEAAGYQIRLSSTMLINNQLYNSYKTTEWIEDAVEFYTK